MSLVLSFHEHLINAPLAGTDSMLRELTLIGRGKAEGCVVTSTIGNSLKGPTDSRVVGSFKKATVGIPYLS